MEYTALRVFGLLLTLYHLPYAGLMYAYAEYSTLPISPFDVFLRYVYAIFLAVGPIALCIILFKLTGKDSKNAGRKQRVMPYLIVILLGALPAYEFTITWKLNNY